MISYKMSWPIVITGRTDLSHSAFRSILDQKVFTMPRDEHHIADNSDVSKKPRTFQL